MNKKLLEVYSLNSEDQYVNFWNKLLPFMKQRCLLLLKGVVGAGKTTSIQSLIKLLGAMAEGSPSFALHYHYEGIVRSLDHVDLYRIESGEELDSLGFWDLFSQKEALIAVEWPERVSLDAWPLNWQILLLEFEFQDQGVDNLLTLNRTISIYELR